MRGEEKQIFWAPFSTSNIGMRYTALASYGNGPGGTGRSKTPGRAASHLCRTRNVEV